MRHEDMTEKQKAEAMAEIRRHRAQFGEDPNQPTTFRHVRSEAEGREYARLSDLRLVKLRACLKKKNA